ncbi:Zinc finger C2H2 type domain-containing protein 8 [Elsinoe fawcettii]|nr:Zinc finger C2H2 type domain-containing protein 8 [Elsinoe fawcettii]
MEVMTQQPAPAGLFQRRHTAFAHMGLNMHHNNNNLYTQSSTGFGGLINTTLPISRSFPASASSAAHISSAPSSATTSFSSNSNMDSMNDLHSAMSPKTRSPQGSFSHGPPLSMPMAEAQLPTEYMVAPPRYSMPVSMAGPPPALSVNTQIPFYQPMAQEGHQSFVPQSLAHQPPVTQHHPQSAHWYTSEMPAMTAPLDFDRRNSMPVLHHQTSMTSMPEYPQSFIKSEAQSPMLPPNDFSHPGSFSSQQSWPHSPSPAVSEDVVFNTDVDCLMRVLQNQDAAAQPAEVRSQRSQSDPKKAKIKKHRCTHPGCGKLFQQKTHLDIHFRAHTGQRPFPCRWPNCHHSFSQLGNLKTHERRHTGERPYACDQCGKTFAQRGNVNAHKATHTKEKKFPCFLENCTKKFSQLGNLKSHQNKFHTDEISRLRSVLTRTDLSPEDVVIREKFCQLFKNCNKGIKGRGKDRRISRTSSSPGIPQYDSSAMVKPEVLSPAPHDAMHYQSGEGGDALSSPTVGNFYTHTTAPGTELSSPAMGPPAMNGLGISTGMMGDFNLPMHDMNNNAFDSVSMNTSFDNINPFAPNRDLSSSLH